MNWMYGPAPVNAGTFVGIAGWAVWATLLAVWQWWLCRRRHCGPHACSAGRFVAWEDQPAAGVARPAESSRDSTRAAS